MKTSNNGQNGKNNTDKMSKIDTFQFEAVDGKMVDDIRREEEERLNSRAGNTRGSDQGQEYRFFTTNSVRKMDTQTVHRMMTTTSLSIPTAPTGKRKPMTKKRMAALIVPLLIILSYIVTVVVIDILGLCGFYFRMSAASVLLYILYLALSIVGILLLMFMDMLPKPLALMVAFISMFCVHGNLFLMVPLIVAFVAIGITVEGSYSRIAVCAIAVFMAFYACVLGVNQSKVLCSDKIYSEDGNYLLVLETADDGKELSYTMFLETTGTMYRKYPVEQGYVDLYYFGEEQTIAYGESNEYGQPKTVKTVKISDVLNR